MKGFFGPIGWVLLPLLLLALSCPCLAKQRARTAPAPAKPAFFASIEQIARGKTFQDPHVRNVSFTLSPMKAGFRIRF